ncbi:MAG: DUF4293 domain-containing protein [Bacteroidales bacterium]|nr:DUF4293 domain-containing protein [Candidatus Physcousia equi]
MIQRIQTVYLLLAVVCVVLGMMNPVGIFRASDSTPLADLYNLWLSVESDGQVMHKVLPWAGLFALLALTASLLAIGIFLYKRLALQMRLVNFSMLILIGYYLVLVGFVLYFNHKQGLALFSGLRPTVWAGMPLIGLILSYLAFRGILKDHLLIKSLNHLR